MEFKNQMKVFTVIAAILLIVGTVVPYRYESGFKLYQSWLDLGTQGITNGTVNFQTNVTNISKNYTVNPYDDTILVDSTKGSVNISIPYQNASGKVYTFKKVDASVGNMTVQAANKYIGNESNTSGRLMVWQGTAPQPAEMNQTYFYSINITRPFNLSTISIHVNQSGTGTFNASLYNDTGNNKPYVQLDSTANTSAAIPTEPSGGWMTARFNGTQLNINEYWIGLQLRNVSVYVGNATHEGITVFNMTNNNTAGIMPHVANTSAAGTSMALNQTGDYQLLVPNIALNLTEIESTKVKGTASQYATFRIQYDGFKWWVI